MVIDKLLMLVFLMFFMSVVSERLINTFFIEDKYSYNNRVATAGKSVIWCFLVMLPIIAFKKYSIDGIFILQFIFHFLIHLYIDDATYNLKRISENEAKFGYCIQIVIMFLFVLSGI